MEKLTFFFQRSNNDSREKEKEKEKKETNNNVNEAEMLAAKQRESLPIEERTSMFKAMLLEKEVGF